MKRIVKTATLFVVMISFPGISTAVYNDVTLTTDAVISVGGVSLNISGSSAEVESLTANANSFDVTILSGSAFVIESADREGFTLSTTGDAATSVIACGSLVSTLTLTSSGSSVVTVTPVATCTATAVPTSIPVGGNGPIVGSYTPPSTPPRPQIMYPDGTVVYLDQTATSTTATTAPSIITSAPNATPYTRSLSVGKSGADVEALQIFLEAKGFLVMPKGTTKGYFGALTKEALIKYQKSVGIDPIGIFGPATRAYVEKLNSGAPSTPTPPVTGSLNGGAKTQVAYTRSLSVGKSGADVEALQIFLEAKGFLVMPKGTTKGYFGALTKEALIKYQKSVGIDPIGIFGPATRAAVGAQE